MRIMVFDVPASQGGALSLLHDFYEEIVQHNNKDIEWITANVPKLMQTTPTLELINSLMEK